MKTVKKVMKWFAIGLFSLIGLAILLLLAARLTVYLQHRITTDNGVDEGIYAELCGEEQYILVRGKSKENPVIIYLHGGPAGADSYLTCYWQKYLVDDFTFISWDQRGCGRTYYQNKDIDPNNETASFEQALEDLDALVRYAKERFGADKVIIMGHSYGTLLGSRYVTSHPENVSAYVGIGQFVSFESENYAFADAVERAKAAGVDTAELEAEYQKFMEIGLAENLENQLKLMELRGQYSQYHAAPRETSGLKYAMLAILSPLTGIDDLRWHFLPMFEGVQRYFALNEQLFEHTFTEDLRERELEFQMPVYLISGSCDWTTPVQYSRDYLDMISAPEKQMLLVDGCGHTPMIDAPQEFSEMVRSMLK